MVQELTIDARMQRVHEHILYERITEPVMIISTHDGRGKVDEPDWNGSSWRNFDKWNDAPIFAFPRRKAQVG